MYLRTFVIVHNTKTLLHHTIVSVLGSGDLDSFPDDRFIMKQIKSVEISSFEQFAPHYFTHVTSALEAKVGTCAIA